MMEYFAWTLFYQIELQLIGLLGFRFGQVDMQQDGKPVSVQTRRIVMITGRVDVLNWRDKTRRNMMMMKQAKRWGGADNKKNRKSLHLFNTAKCL